MEDDRHRLDETNDEQDDDGSLGLWAAFERDGGETPLTPVELNVDALKERLKRGARHRSRPDERREP